MQRAQKEAKAVGGCKHEAGEACVVYLIDLMLQAHIDVRGDGVSRLHFQLLCMRLQVVGLERHVLRLSLRASLQ